MTMQTRPRFVASLWVFALVAGAVSSVSAAGQRGAPDVKAVPYSGIPSMEGKDTFAAYCAACHGVDARGKGPAAPAMKAPVPDLTVLKTRDGKFNAAAVEYVIRGTGKTPTPVHGTSDMPVWGPVFASSGARAAADVRINNLVQYLASIQRAR